MKNKYYATAVAKVIGVTPRFVRKARQGKQPHAEQLTALLKGADFQGVLTKEQHDKKYRHAPQNL